MSGMEGKPWTIFNQFPKSQMGNNNPWLMAAKSKQVLIRCLRLILNKNECREFLVHGKGFV
jgi:hypothetical protein